MNRTEKLKRYCKGRKKYWVAKQQLGISPQALSYLLRINIDKLVERIDALRLDEDKEKVA